MQKLPIEDCKKKIIETVFENQVVIIVGETGSGKTTQVPQFLYHAGFAKEGIIGVTEPRQIAAISTASFVAKSLGTMLGEKVGYQVRFDDMSADNTQVKFMTDGILLREFQSDPDLQKYSLIMVDEAHERSQNIDFVLGLLKDALTRRKDLKVIVASATIDEQKFSKYFWDAPIINVSGRTFPVQTVWADFHITEEDMAGEAIETALEIHRKSEPGDILIFTTGEDEIKKIVNGIDKHEDENLITIPVYAALPAEDQQKVFQEYPGKRKVIVATNIAETSITIDGVVYVVDTGLIKQSNFHPETGLQRLEVVMHSQAGCDQRNGRAGRTQPGVCYRLYTKEDFEERPKFTEPEIRRSALASIVLTMEHIGIENVKGFDFIDPPEKAAFTEAYETLIALGAIRRGKKGLTEIGKAMANLPLEPRIARMLLNAQQYGCVKEVATIAAFISGKPVFVFPEKKEFEARQAHWRFKDPSSDALTSLRVWKAYEEQKGDPGWCRENFLSSKALYEISRVRKQLFEILEKRKIELSESGNNDAITKAVCSGLVYNLFVHCYREWFQGVFRKNGEPVAIHPGSSVFGDRSMRWVVASSLRKTSKPWMLGCTTVKIEWLPEITPNMFKIGATILESYEPNEGKCIAKRSVLYQDQPAGEFLVEISIAEARSLQEEAIRDAQQKGLVLLTIKKNPFSSSIIDESRAVNEEQGIECRMFSWEILGEQEGTQYYCRIEEGFDGKYARPVLRVFDLPRETSGTQGIKDLATRWGATIRK